VVSVSVSAPASDEYTISPATLIFGNGSVIDQTVTLTAAADDITGDTETVTITLINATGNATIGAATVAVTINDTTPEPEIPEVEIPETQGTAAVFRNLNLATDDFTGADTIWGCATEVRTNAESNFTQNQASTLWLRFLDDGTYFYGSSTDGNQPDALLNSDVWSANGRVLQLDHLDASYRNTLFSPDDQTLLIYRTADDRINCSRESTL